MKEIKNLLTVIVIASALASSATAMIAIDTKYVGNSNNTADSNGYGAVAYDYKIGTYEVTNSQYVSFLNAKAKTDTYELYATQMGQTSEHGGIDRTGSSGSYTYSVKAGMGNSPVNHVNFWDAARFTNWLTSGDTEVGVYNLGGVLNPTNASITRNAAAWDAGGVAIASRDEWYKAAYYDPNFSIDEGGYWDYAHQSNSISTADANYANTTLTDVGTYSAAASYYGTFDQGGNVWEWNDTIAGSGRDLRGGAFTDVTETNLSSSTGFGYGTLNQLSIVGFRISIIPEPSTYAAMLGCLALALATMRRKGHCRL